MRARAILAAMAISSLGSVNGGSIAANEGGANLTEETCTAGDDGCVSIQTDKGLSLMQRATMRARVGGGSILDDAGGTDPDKEKNTLASHSICPDEAEDEAIAFWINYFQRECSVAEDDVTDEIKTALGKATSVPDVHGNSDNVRCVISAAGVMEASNLVFVVELN